MPPTLYVFEDDAAQPVRTEKFEMQLEGTTRLLLSIETNIAPPAALLAPGLYDDQVETLLLILQSAIVKPADCNTATAVFEAFVGCSYA
jgi:hypothetical protein